jgi:hypothetical protein
MSYYEKLNYFNQIPGNIRRFHFWPVPPFVSPLPRLCRCHPRPNSWQHNNTHASRRGRPANARRARASSAATRSFLPLQITMRQGIVGASLKANE